MWEGTAGSPSIGGSKGGSTPSSPNKPLVLVCGGTGLQGGACIASLLATGRWRVRTLTRNARSAAAKELAVKGVEVIEADLKDRAALLSALQGVDSCFAATFSDHDGTEVEQGRSLGESLVEAGVQRVVFSGGEATGIDAIDNKAKIEANWRTLPLPWVVFLHTAFFFENIVTKRHTKRVKVSVDLEGNETYEFSIPLAQDLAIPFISSRDIGRFGATVLMQPDKFTHGQVVAVAGDIISPQQFVECFSDVTGKRATYQQLDLDHFRKMPIPGADIIARLYEWYHQGCPGKGHERDPEHTRALCPAVMDTERWMRTVGAHLIESMAFREGLLNTMHDLMLKGAMWGYGSYLRLRQGATR